MRPLPIDFEMAIANGPCPFDPPCGCQSFEDAERNGCACYHHGLSTLRRDMDAAVNLLNAEVAALRNEIETLLASAQEHGGRLSPGDYVRARNALQGAAR